MLDEIGAGRFGPVYRARDDASGALVAIKVFDQGLTAEQAASLADALGRLCSAPLDHPVILRILATGAVGDRVWIAEPWVDAEPLDHVMRRDGAQPLGDVLLRITPIAGALDFASAVGIHHGTLHPRDILVSDDRTLLTGMGELQALGDAGLEVPMEGAYVSPQRAQGLTVSARDDIFSLAAIAYELVHGAPVPERSRLRASMPRLTGVSEARLADVLERSLSPVPGDRPSTALELAAALQGALVDSMAAPGADPIPIPIRDSEPSVPDSSADPGIPIPVSPAPAGPVADDLPLRSREGPWEPAAEWSEEFASKPEPEWPNANAAFESPGRNAESEFRSQNDESELPSRNAQSESRRGGAESESRNQNAESALRGWNAESEWRGRSVESGLRSQNAESTLRSRNAESESEYGYWLPIAAALAIGILTGFASGFVVGQRDSTPAPLSAERAVPRAQRSTPGQKPAPTAGRDFTESVVPPQPVTEQPVIPPPEPGPTASTRQDPLPKERIERDDRNGRNERTERPQTPEPSERPERLDVGTLQIESRPRGARVFVDGLLVGTTPLLLADVRPGAHAVRIDLSGYRPWVTSVTVAAGTRQRVAASLER